MSKTTDIIIYYKMDCAEDKVRIKPIVNLLRAEGYVVFWAEDPFTGKWPEVVTRKTAEAKIAIPVWSRSSIDVKCPVNDEAVMATKNSTSLVHLRLDDVDLPLPFTTEHAQNFIGWDGDKNKECFMKLLSVLRSVKGFVTGSEAVKFITINNKKMYIPSFVRSVSSHETFIKPEQALKALNYMPSVEPVLVSAFDLYFYRKSPQKSYTKLMNAVRDLASSGCPIVLDSGNYEAGRKSFFKDGKIKESKNALAQGIWCKDKFNAELNHLGKDLALFDGVFCFDDVDPLRDTTTIPKYVNKIKKRVEEVPKSKGIPIVHALMDKKTKEREHSSLPEIFYQLSIALKNPPIIAVPERELGEEVFEIATNIKNIRTKLDELGYYQAIHILGTGNPLTMSILYAAGADFFDGLEWCRTVVNRDNGHLFHYKQFDIFKVQSLENPSSETIRGFLGTIIGDKENKFSTKLKVAVHNLDFFFEYFRGLRKYDRDNEFLIHLTSYAGSEFKSQYVRDNFIACLKKVIT